MPLCRFWRGDTPFFIFQIHLNKNPYGNKTYACSPQSFDCSVLAKILMVTKPFVLSNSDSICSVLAKIHMVTKPSNKIGSSSIGSVLAKIHMVTKLEFNGSTFLNVIEY